ncbi:transcription factor E2F7 [Dunckerocampus dactyliophorus]|uniref:transcription factor E2F7 n=1 Tax=Dunckerocampus dactyliophorus TaxID=161453 RepID=UPI002404B0C0|nr:transcription factor E2F7 [Dunckerocampus dactyliophorus]
MEVQCLALQDLTSPRKSCPEGDGDRREQKENICTVRRRGTPLKCAESCTPVLKRGGDTPGLDHVTPIKHTATAEPWTPTANLKMLISAASPDIRNREMKEKKVLFRPIENESESVDVAREDVEGGQFEAAVEEDEDAEKKPSRKQKSLGLLCQKFLALYPDYPPSDKPIFISLDEVATSLGMERRRIYDIVNVLESLMIVGRMEKNSYTWYGRLRLEATLEDLQERGHQQGYHLHMENATVAGREAGPSHESDGGEDDSSHAAGNRKDKSLRIMSQKFVMLFLVSKTQTVTLEVAAKVLIEESQDSSSHSKYKTKVRRLYDIANVLTSLGLIKKMHVREERGRKPAFRWLGPVKFNKSRNSENAMGVATLEACRSIAGQDLRKSKLARHSSFNITPTSVAIQRQVSSAPSSPGREITGFPHQPVDYSRKTRANEAVCRLQFGNPKGNSSSTLAQPSPQTTVMVPTLQPEQLVTLSSSPQCLAYLPSLSQPSVVMLYNPPNRSAAEGAAECPRLPSLECEQGRKRRREMVEEEQEVVAVKRSPSGLERGDEKAEGQSGVCKSASDESIASTSQPSHYLYVPNNAGLKSLNFLFPTGQPPAHLPLPPGAVSPMALPYILVPSSAFSQYPLLAGGRPQQGGDPKVSFNLPAHFMMAAAPYSVAAAPEVGQVSPVSPPSTPEQSRKGYSGVSFPHSPPGHRQTVCATTRLPLTPHTPKEIPAPSSKAFFQTPGTVMDGTGATPAARKRGSAQRRLDISHPSTC